MLLFLLIQVLFGFGGDIEELGELFTRVLAAAAAVRDLLFKAAFSHFALGAVGEVDVARGEAAHAVDVPGLYLVAVHLRPGLGRLPSLVVAVMQRGEVGGAGRAVEPAHRDHLIHGFLLLEDHDFIMGAEGRYRLKAVTSAEG